MRRHVFKRCVELTLFGAALVVLAAPAGATDADTSSRVRVAAIGDGGSRPVLRDVENMRDLWQLVQATGTQSGEATQGTADPTSILAAVAASAPESTEEELARQHGLEIVKRVTLSTLDLRVVTFRTRESDGAAAIVQRLRADPRVSSAQINFAYRAIDPDQTQVSGTEHPRHTARLDEKATPVTGKRKPARSAASDRIEVPPRPKAVSEHGTTRGVRITAADVLAGGL